jgi:hypothetical protein
MVCKKSYQYNGFMMIKNSIENYLQKCILKMVILLFHCKVNSLGHCITLQVRFSVSLPLQSAPRKAGSGLLHSLDHTSKPPPQDTEQSPVFCQSDQPPSTERYYFKVL